MAKKQTAWKTKGMNRDASVSAFNSEFSFENINLRLATNDSNTLMSWVTERGTKELVLHIQVPSGSSARNNAIEGVPIGTAVINHKLVIFTTDANASKPDYIYKFEKSSSSLYDLEGILLYNGKLNFSTEYPLETLVSYESDVIEKVYWTDGLNQPRVINIADTDKVSLWNETRMDGENIAVDTFFDFVPSVELTDSISVERLVGGGIFAPGTIQYCYSYINKNGQQSNIVSVSPLYYISHEDRGGSPEEKVSNSFIVTIKDVDTNFDYIRLYSIQHTSLNDGGYVRNIVDIPRQEFYYTELVYDNSDNKTLPRVGGAGTNHILTARPYHGEYSVSLSDVVSGGYDNTAYLWVVGYNSSTQTVNPLLSLKFVMDNLESGPNAGAIISSYKYCKGFKFTEDIMDSFSGIITEEYPEIALKFGDDIISGNNETGLLGYQVLYNYHDQKWYVLGEEGSATETETKTSMYRYLDNGTTGSVMDPTELLYVGGREITALTMIDKDRTLFLGNIEQKNTLVNDIQDYYRNRDKDVVSKVEFKYDSESTNVKLQDNPIPASFYGYTSNLKHNSRQITTFKGGENYRFGFQLQKATGEWLDPIWLDDVENPLYPKCEVENPIIKLPYAETSIDLSDISNIDYSLYKRIRPVIVYPTIEDRKVLCQGVLNPTVFNAMDRIENAPYAQASWYFRPYVFENILSDIQKIQESSSVVITNHGSSAPGYTGNYSSGYHYFLVMDVSKAAFKEIATRGYLELVYYATTASSSAEGTYGIDNIYYRGIIILGDAESISGGISAHCDYRIAFVSSKPWEVNDYTLLDVSVEKQGTVYDTITYTYVYQGLPSSEFVYIGASTHNVTNNGHTTQTFTPFAFDITLTHIYGSGLDTYHNVYYFKGYEDSSTYSCAFYVDANPNSTPAYYGYKVTMNKLDINFAETVGNSLVYQHYSPLCSQSSLVKKTSLINVCPESYDSIGVKNIEIQGSIDFFTSAFDTVKDKREVVSNTQFFVDQSIVTLNSPDIDFDTEVQAFGTENLKLKIVGAIPLTGNASYHKISATDLLETSHNRESSKTRVTGYGEIDKNILHTNIDCFGGKRLVSEYLWNDVCVFEDSTKEDKIITSRSTFDFLVYPWQSNSPLNGDYRGNDVASSQLQTKIESTLLYSINSSYFYTSEEEYHTPYIDSFETLDSYICLAENAEVFNTRLPGQKGEDFQINYYANIDKTLYNKDGFYPLTSNDSEAIVPNPFLTGTEYYKGDVDFKTDSSYNHLVEISSPIMMKYKSTSHAVISLEASDSTSHIPILPSLSLGNYTAGVYRNPAYIGSTFWGKKGMSFTQENINLDALFGESYYDILLLGELCKDSVNPFGGTTDSAIRNNTWQVGGDAVQLVDGQATIIWTQGDTYYQRYDCLKTYPFTKEDKNQLVEMLSFMCETHVNLDGRYDRNRGQLDNTNMSPENFNIINEVYNQRDNFFTYKVSKTDAKSSLKYPNWLTYSKTKQSGADVDLWTNVTLASVLELDGDKGEINSLRRFNDQVIAFQDSGISQILYNENVQISSTQGVPIEIANSGKVQGNRYLSNTVGCSNKWSIVNTPSGIYFMDSINKAIYLFNGQLNNLSSTLGFNTWAKTNIPDFEYKWSPDYMENFVSYYDKLNQDILFINGNTALAYSEKLGTFTSFYGYEDAPYFINMDDVGLWLSQKHLDYSPTYRIWEHQAGDYLKFFGQNRSYSMTLIGNPEPLVDKTFTNLEFRASVDGEGVYNESTGRYTPDLPFDYLETWNEYQHGIASLQNMRGMIGMQHHNVYNNPKGSLKRKFRIWRCDIPRDNYPVDPSNQNIDDLGITRFKAHPLDRMRNPWVYIKLQKNAASQNCVLQKAEIHDIVMTYFD